MKAMKNINADELYKAAKKRKNSHKDEATYTDGFFDGAEYMRQKAVKENISLREKILELKAEVVKRRKEFLKMTNLAKKLAMKLEHNMENENQESEP